MPRRFDPSVLFGPRRWNPKLSPYKGSQRAVLDAVKARRKPLMREGGFTVDSIGNVNRDYIIELLHEALDRGLSVTLHSQYPSMSRAHRPVDLYVLQLDETWRISALHALHDVRAIEGSWSLASSKQESMLLGYTAGQRKAWFADDIHQRPAVGAMTLYSLLTKPQRSLAVSLGKNSFGTAADLVGREFFIDRNDGDIKENALALLPEGTTLARVGFDWRKAHLLFGRPLAKLKRRGIVRATASTEFAELVNESLRSKIQFLTKRGWR